MLAGTDLKILIIDDMSSMREFIKLLLSQIGLTNTFQANDGSTALPMIINASTEGHPYDLIISDWNMPGITGIDLLKILRRTPTLAKVPFLMISMEAENINIEVATKAGVTGFLTKPFSAQILQESINKIFNENCD